MTRWRALWLVVLMFVIFVGVSATGAYYTYGVERRDRARNDKVQQQQDSDMCALIGALLPTGGPTPSPGSALAQQRAAVASYRASRC